MEGFSKRFGYRTQQQEITIREEAPESLRAFVLKILYGFGGSAARQIVCSTLSKLPDRSNWSGNNVWDEVVFHVESCEWFLIYDLLEVIQRSLRQRSQIVLESGVLGPEQFRQELNDLCVEHGIGWKMTDDQILTRGDESFEAVMQAAPQALLQVGMVTAAQEIHQSILDLSKRPVPDLTGAIQHGMAALECAGKHVCGMFGKQTLDDVVKARHDLFRPPLNEGIVKLWGFASNRGRHLTEGSEPSQAEVELVVGVAAAVATYLSKVAGPKP